MCLCEVVMAKGIKNQLYSANINVKTVIAKLDGIGSGREIYARGYLAALVDVEKALNGESLIISKFWPFSLFANRKYSPRRNTKKEILYRKFTIPCISNKKQNEILFRKFK